MDRISFSKLVLSYSSFDGLPMATNLPAHVEFWSYAGPPGVLPPWTDPSYRTLHDFSSNYSANANFVITNGCQIDTSDAPNCSSACVNTTWLLTSPFTISSCVAASRIAISLPDLDTDSNNQAQSLGIYPNSPNLTGIIRAVDDCFNAYCNSSSNACASNGRHCATLSQLPFNNMTVASTALQECVASDVCQNTPIVVSSDLGGIGVTHFPPK